MGNTAGRAGAGLLIAAGCSQQAKEKEPVVSVQTMAAQRAAISQSVSTEAVVFPLEQATVAPKITSTVKKFFVQRGSRVKKGQLLAELENADLSATAEASKGDYDLAEANYAMTVGAGLPQQIQKAELDAASARAAFEAPAEKFTKVAKICCGRARFRGATWKPRKLRWHRRAAKTSRRKNSLVICNAGQEQELKSARGSKESAEGKYHNAAALLSYSLIKSPIDG